MFVANSSNSSYNLRNTATDLKLPKKNPTNGQKCFSYNDAKMWNSLLTESKLAPSLASFKKSLVHMKYNVLQKQKVFTTLSFLLLPLHIKQANFIIIIFIIVYNSSFAFWQQL